MRKILLVCILGLGLPSSDALSRPTLAFLGMGEATDPLIRLELTRKIHWELAADTGISVVSREAVDLLYAKGVLRGPAADPAEMPDLKREIGAEFYAFGELEPMTVASKRIWWKPWSLNVVRTQGVRLRVLEGDSGKVVFDGRVTAEFPEKALITAPDADLGGLPPLQRESILRKSVSALSLEAAKALSLAVKTKAPGGADGGNSDPVNPDPANPDPAAGTGQVP